MLTTLPFGGRVLPGWHGGRVTVRPLPESRARRGPAARNDSAGRGLLLSSASNLSPANHDSPTVPPPQDRQGAWASSCPGAHRPPRRVEAGYASINWGCEQRAGLQTTSG